MKRIIILLTVIIAFNLTAEAQTKEFSKLLSDAETFSMTKAQNENYSISVTRLPGEMIQQLTKVDTKDKSLVENRIEKIYHIKIKGRGLLDYYTRAFEIAQKEPYLHYSTFRMENGSQYRIFRYNAVRYSDYIILIDNSQAQNYSIFYVSGKLEPQDIISLLDIKQYKNDDISLYTRGKVYNVSYESFNRYPQLDITIDSIEFTDEATIMQVTIYFEPNYWIRFGNEHLWANGIQYQLQSVDKCALGEKYVMPASGRQSFTLTFPPINAKVTTMDWKGNTADSWKIIGIKIDNIVK
ncbi:MAG: hypothetical protein IKM03_00450 [Alistipes sp.]|nr:hypothetical protein [Alistipes sp.]